MTKISPLAAEYEVTIPGSRWTARVVYIDPTGAATLLANNNCNRRIRRATVAKYAAMMRDGKWRTSPEPIIISENDILLNGQHRLHAVILSGKTIAFLVISEVGEEAFQVLDRGATRSAADALRIDKKLAEVSAFIARAAFGYNFGISTLPDSDIARVAEVMAVPHADLIEACNTAAKVFSSVPFRVAACLRLLTDADRDRVLNLYRNLCLGHVSELPPIAQSLIGAVASGRINKTGGGVAQTDLFCRAWDVMDPAKSEQTRIQLKSTQRHMDELRAIILGAFDAPEPGEAA